MSRQLFIAQQTLTDWLDQDKILFQNNLLTVKADGRKFRMVEAVRFIRVESGGEDRSGLVGKVKTNQQLTEIGAERYQDSVLVQDVAYKVQEGFIGEPILEGKPRQSAVAGPSTTLVPKVASGQPQEAKAEAKAGAKDKKREEDMTDEELLVRFLLNNL